VLSVILSWRKFSGLCSGWLWIFLKVATHGWDEVNGSFRRVVLVSSFITTFSAAGQLKKNEYVRINRDCVSLYHKICVTFMLCIIKLICTRRAFQRFYKNSFSYFFLPRVCLSRFSALPVLVEMADVFFVKYTTLDVRERFADVPTCFADLTEAL